MIVKVEENSFVQKCVCGKLHARSYSDHSNTAGFITLTPCDECGSLEVLGLNTADDDHSRLVQKIFLKVMSQG